MRVLLFLMCLCVNGAWAADHHGALYRAETSRPLPRCEGLPTTAELCRLIRQAQDRVAKIPLSLIEKKVEVKKGKKVTVGKILSREFALTAYSPATQEWHDILLSMPLVGNATFQPAVRTAHEPPYEVKRVKGETFNKMTFDVRMGDQMLFVYAAKHLSTPAVFQNRDINKMAQEVEVITYLSTPPYLANEEFARLGKAYVRAALEEVLAELRKAGVSSKAYPGKLVGELVTSEMLLNLLVDEQTDPCLLKERDRGCMHLIPAMFYKNDHEVIEAVMSEFVLNGFQSYRHICSHVPACGAFQFTNNTKKEKVKNKEGKFTYEVRLGTYDSVRAEYPAANLDPQFRRGTKSFLNSAKATALLMDLELSRKRTPSWVRQAFVTDERVGALLSAAGHNGGPSQLQRLAALLVEFGRQKGIRTIIFESFPWTEFLAWVKIQEKTLLPETYGYIQKSLNYWTHPRLHKP